MPNGNALGSSDLKLALSLAGIIGASWGAAEAASALGESSGNPWSQFATHVVLAGATLLVCYALLHAFRPLRARAAALAAAVTLFAIVTGVVFLRVHFLWLVGGPSWISLGHALALAAALVCASAAARAAYLLARRRGESLERLWPAATLMTIACLAPAWRGVTRSGPSFSIDTLVRADAPYNVLLVTIDTLRRDHVTSYGYGAPTARELERFGFTRFEQAYAVASWTRPSTATILTGLYPSSHGAVGVNGRLHSDAVTLAERLHALGFATGHYAGNLNASAVFGMDQGADATTGNPYVPAHPLAGTTLGEVLRRRALNLQDARELTREAQRFLDAAADRRFFLYLHYEDPHTPYDPPPDLLARWAPHYSGRVFERPRPDLDMTAEEVQHMVARYDGDIENAARSLAQLLGELERRGELARTLVIVTSDHGESFGEHGRWNHSTTPYEELIRIPLLVRPPAGLPRVDAVPQAVSHIDIVPTVLDYLGARLPEGLPGHSLRPAVEGHGDDVERLLLAECARVGQWSVNRGQWKLIAEDDGSSFELYDLGSDPHELVDLASSAEHASVARELLQQGLDLREALSRSGLRASAGADDAETRRRLRELGYGE